MMAMNVPFFLSQDSFVFISKHKFSCLTFCYMLILLHWHCVMSWSSHTLLDAETSEWNFLWYNCFIFFLLFFKQANCKSTLCTCMCNNYENFTDYRTSSIRSTIILSLKSLKLKKAFYLKLMFAERFIERLSVSWPVDFSSSEDSLPEEHFLWP